MKYCFHHRQLKRFPIISITPFINFQTIREILSLRRESQWNESKTFWRRNKKEQKNLSKTQTFFNNKDVEWLVLPTSLLAPTLPPPLISWLRKQPFWRQLAIVYTSCPVFTLWIKWILLTREDFPLANRTMAMHFRARTSPFCTKMIIIYGRAIYFPHSARNLKSNRCKKRPLPPRNYHKILLHSF